MTDIRAEYTLTAWSKSTRRAIILRATAVGTAGAGVTAAADGLTGSVEAQADVQAEQALRVTELTVNSAEDATFTRIFKLLLSSTLVTMLYFSLKFQITRQTT